MDGALAQLDDELTLWPVKSDQVDAVWERVRPEIERAMTYADGLIDTKTVYDCLKSRDMQLWAVFKGESVKAVCVTQIVAYPGRTVARIVALSGYRMTDWYQWIDQGKLWAAQNGAEEYQAFVADERLAKLLERKGWKRTFFVMTRPV